MNEKPKKLFDVFISYSSADKPWVYKLKSALENNGLKVWFDEEQIVPGDCLVNALEMGIQSSRTMVLVVSPASMASGWVNEEYNRAMTLSLEKKQNFRLIPVVLKATELPGFGKSRLWVDFTNENSFKNNIKRLIQGICKNDKNNEPIVQQAKSELSGEISTGSCDQAAAVCFRKENNQIQFLLIRSSGRRWIFPKGKIEPGEPPWIAAKRNAHEEAGVAGNINKKPFTTFKHLKHDLKKNGQEIIIAAFLLNVEMTYTPQEKYREPTWFRPEEALVALSEDRDFFYAEEFKRVINIACSSIRYKSRYKIKQKSAKHNQDN